MERFDNFLSKRKNYVKTTFNAMPNKKALQPQETRNRKLQQTKRKITS